MLAFVLMGRVLYRVERAGAETLGFPVPLDEAIEQIRRRLPKEDEGALRAVRIEYDLDPSRPPTVHTAAMREAWRGTVLRFPDIGWMGTFVCKPLQHGRRGNATDWGPPDKLRDDDAIEYLWNVFDFVRSQGMHFEESNGARGLPYSETIFRDKIATRATADWQVRPYTGTLHAIHDHASAYPLQPPGACD